eukprot:6048731-Pyramimonas_sp.AAC.1
MPQIQKSNANSNALDFAVDFQLLASRGNGEGQVAPDGASIYGRLAPGAAPPHALIVWPECPHD